MLYMVIIETTIFTRQVQALLADEEYRKLQIALAERPDLGALIPQGGGLRKVRWGVAGTGRCTSDLLLGTPATATPDALCLCEIGAR
jgi:hypothetical protein